MPRISVIKEGEASKNVQDIFTEIEDDIEKSEFAEKALGLITFARKEEKYNHRIGGEYV